MNEEQLHKQAEQDLLELKASADKPLENKRRRLIKGAAAAIPVIMTLHSGAALARTSNLVGPFQYTSLEELEAGAAKDGGDLICLQPGVDSGPVPDGDGTIDLGTSFGYTTDSTQLNGEPDLVTQAKVCQGGGGILVSVNAWGSIMPKITLM